MAGRPQVIDLRLLGRSCHINAVGLAESAPGFILHADHMPDIHTIRLRGPWQMEPLAETAPIEAAQPVQGGALPSQPVSPTARRVKMPAKRSAVIPGDYSGRVRFVRTFQRPTGLEPHETVQLVVDTPWTIANMLLNELPLDMEGRSAARRAWNISDRLTDANRLAIELKYATDDAAPPEAPLLGEVWLEIVGV